MSVWSAVRLARAGQGWAVPQGLYYSFAEFDLMELRRDGEDGDSVS